MQKTDNDRRWTVETHRHLLHCGFNKQGIIYKIRYECA